VASFYETEFAGDSSFYECNFTQEANFNRAKFVEDCYFEGSQFGKYANFGAAQFLKDASFYQAVFKWRSSFSDALFSRMTYFDRALFMKSAEFEGAQFNRYANFDGAEFNEEANFDSVEFGELSYFKGARFGGQLTLNHTQFSAIQIDWDAIKGRLAYNEAVYLALIKNFENLGYFMEADNCYFQYRVEKHIRETSIQNNFIDVLAWITCGYGVRPIYSIAFSLIIVVIFGIAFWFGKAIPRMKNPSIPGHESALFSILDAIYDSAVIFIIHPPPEWRPRGRWKYVMLIEDISGFLLMALFLVVLGKVMIR